MLGSGIASEGLNQGPIMIAFGQECHNRTKIFKMEYGRLRKPSNLTAFKFVFLNNAHEKYEYFRARFSRGTLSPKFLSLYIWTYNIPKLR
jgi:hypothetical protein